MAKRQDASISSECATLGESSFRRARDAAKIPRWLRATHAQASVGRASCRYFGNNCRSVRRFQREIPRTRVVFRSPSQYRSRCEVRTEVRMRVSAHVLRSVRNRTEYSSPQTRSGQMSVQRRPTSCPADVPAAVLRASEPRLDRAPGR